MCGVLPRADGICSQHGGFAPVQVKRMVAYRPVSAPPRQVPRSLGAHDIRPN